jgi:hypothetical protein
MTEILGANHDATRPINAHGLRGEGAALYRSRET